MSNVQPLVSVIVVGHNRPRLLAEVLDSITAQTYQSLEIIVVDNKSESSDEIAEVVRGYRGVRLIQNSDDRGFTGGANTGFAAARGEYVYLTVDDVIHERDSIEHLVRYAQQEAQPLNGLLSGILLNADRRTICSAGGEVSLAPIYRRSYIGSGDQDVGQYVAPFEVSCIDGAMVFSRTSYMRALGGFREEFFMYSDSIELSARVRKAGGRIVIVPQARAYVYDPPHAFKQESMSFHRMKNLYAMYLLHARWRVLPEFFLRYGVIIPLRSMLTSREYVWPLVKAWGWFLFKTPSLLLERARAANNGALAAEVHPGL